MGIRLISKNFSSMVAGRYSGWPVSSLEPPSVIARGFSQKRNRALNLVLLAHKVFERSPGRTEYPMGRVLPVVASWTTNVPIHFEVILPRLIQLLPGWINYRWDPSGRMVLSLRSEVKEVNSQVCLQSPGQSSQWIIARLAPDAKMSLRSLRPLAIHAIPAIPAIPVISALVHSVPMIQQWQPGMRSRSKSDFNLRITRPLSNFNPTVSSESKVQTYPEAPEPTALSSFSGFTKISHWRRAKGYLHSAEVSSELSIGNGLPALMSAIPATQQRLPERRTRSLSNVGLGASSRQKDAQPLRNALAVKPGTHSPQNNQSPTIADLPDMPGAYPYGRSLTLKPTVKATRTRVPVIITDASTLKASKGAASIRATGARFSSMTFLENRKISGGEGEVSGIQGPGAIYSSYPKPEQLSRLNVQITKEKLAIKEALHGPESRLKASDPNALDLNRISDRVCSIIERRLLAERERRGIFG